MSIFKNINRNTIFIGIAVVGIIVTGILISVKSSNGFSISSISNIFGISDSQIGKRAVDYINANKLSQTPASLVSVSEESGLIKIKIKIDTSEFDSYATKDGKFLFPQALDMSGKKAEATDSTKTPETNKPVTKNDKPMLEAYVVARCPYGLQMQRAMADAVKNLPSLAQYLTVRYMGSVSGNTITSMHGEAEATENFRQICIREEQPTKYWNYVSCQMKAGDTTGCTTSTGVDSAKLSACIKDTSRGITYAKKDFDLNTKYNVSGSPTLVLNGSNISETGYGGRSSDGVKSMVCAGFNTEASFCSTKLNTAEAAASFSTTYSTTNAPAAAANSGAAGTNCAPAQ
jgi:hypothetical protein